MRRAGAARRPRRDETEAVLGGLDAAFAAAMRLDDEAYAADVVEEAERRQTLRDRIARLRFGPPVVVRLADRSEIRGRVVAVGVDWVRVVEGDLPGGLGVAADHVVALGAVVAVTSQVRLRS
ncbi:MAG: hypothetical protein K1X95_15460 [Acidimicrobiia bacterium]|nr:hypothetical protein [Acidimicrobiia bacterium]